MIQSFNFKSTPSLIFGAGKIMELPNLLGQFGKKLLVVAGGSSFTSGPVWPTLEMALIQNGFSLALCRIDNEPSPADIDQISDQYREENIDAVIAIGGGSVLDTGKAVSAMLAENGSVADFLEGVGTRKPSGLKVPFIAVPTTSGTGSEATSNAVICSVGPEGFKKSLRHDKFIPDLALLDPQLTISCPRELTISCGMDTFSQLVEAYLSTNASPITDALALTGIRTVIQSLPQAIADGNNLEARSDLCYGSYLSGIVLANAGLGTVHGFASALGGYFPIPHGIVCGTLMAAANMFALEQLLTEPESQPSAIALSKYAALGRMIKEETTSQVEDAMAFISYLVNLTESLHLPKLSSFSISYEDLEKVVATSSNKYNPVQFTDEQLLQILRARL
ncbi:iron-containing alcohol dehydrogenase [Desulfosediminicola sp.]|uniref:iron-containing alcohol dehydrogenase n=1 Tax=Desulfosediminicola sp. TaxID=2886825 RepID=UPI003AF25E6A